MNLVEFVKAKRKQAGLTQVQLAHYTGVGLHCCLFSVKPKVILAYLTLNVKFARALLFLSSSICLIIDWNAELSSELNSTVN